MKIKSVRGTHDLLPESVARWQKIEAEARGVFQLYGYEEVRTPILERSELFARSIGAEIANIRDRVAKQAHSIVELPAVLVVAPVDARIQKLCQK